MGEIMPKVSDYVFCKYLIESACHRKSCSFFDFNISSEKDGLIGLLDNGTLSVGDSKSWAETNFRIIRVYFDNFEKITGQKLFTSEEEKTNVLACVASFFGEMSTNPSLLPEARSDEVVVRRLYQSPLLWILMKDIICPSYQIPINNIKIVMASSQECDIAHYVDKDEPFVFLNKDVECDSIRDAFALYSVIEAHGLHPMETIKELLLSPVKEKIMQTLDLAYPKESQANDFALVLYMFSGIENYSEQIMVSHNKVSSSTDIMQKNAQIGSTGDSSFWYLGLVEKMLEPQRGSDWSTYEVLMPWFQEVQEKLNVARAEAGREGLNYEALLRTISGENDKKSNNTLIENRLTPNRVW
jgi:hypothetical protein